MDEPRIAEQVRGTRILTGSIASKRRTIINLCAGIFPDFIENEECFNIILLCVSLQIHSPLLVNYVSPKLLEEQHRYFDKREISLPGDCLMVPQPHKERLGFGLDVFVQQAEDILSYRQIWLDNKQNEILDIRNGLDFDPKRFEIYFGFKAKLRF